MKKGIFTAILACFLVAIGISLSGCSDSKTEAPRYQLEDMVDQRLEWEALTPDEHVIACDIYKSYKNEKDLIDGITTGGGENKTLSQAYALLEIFKEECR